MDSWPKCLSATVNWVSRNEKTRLSWDFGPYLFYAQKKHSAAVEKPWNRPEVKNGTGGIVMVPPKTYYKPMNRRRRKLFYFSPLLEGCPLTYDIDQMGLLLYKLSVRTDYEKFAALEYFSNENASPPVMRTLVKWHFSEEHIREFCLLPEFYHWRTHKDFCEILHEVVERGVYRKLLDSFVSTMYENLFPDLTDALRRMLTNESFWRLGIFDKIYEPSRKLFNPFESNVES